MLQLNDDCLCKIFGMLTLKEQLIQTDVCLRFRSIISNVLWRAKFREVPPSNALVKRQMARLSYREYQTLFALISQQIVKLISPDTRFTSYLNHFTEQPQFLELLYYDFPKLQTLDCRRSRVHDGHMSLVAAKCPRLKVLYLSSNYVTGKFLKDMLNLKELYASKCSLDTLHLKDIILNLNLAHLDLSGANAFDAANLIEASNLQELQLSENSIDMKFVENIQNMRNLRVLRICDLSIDPETNTMWLCFLENIGSLIKELKILNTSQSTLVQTICRNSCLLRNLQKLHSNGTFKDLKPLLILNTLRELHLHEKLLQELLTHEKYNQQNIFKFEINELKLDLDTCVEYVQFGFNKR